MAEQLQRGAAEILDGLKFDLKDLARCVETAAKTIRSNPGICADELKAAAQLVADLRDRLDDELVPLLERRALRDDLRDATEAMRAAVTLLARLSDDDDPAILPLRRKA